MRARDLTPTDRTPRYVVVELFDDAHTSAEQLTQEIVGNLVDVKSAQPAYQDGFGRLVTTGTLVTYDGLRS